MEVDGGQVVFMYVLVDQEGGDKVRVVERSAFLRYIFYSFSF